MYERAYKKSSRLSHKLSKIAYKNNLSFISNQFNHILSSIIKNSLYISVYIYNIIA